MQNFIGISRVVDGVRSNAGSALKNVQRSFEETALKAAGLGEEDEALYRLSKRTEAYLRAVDAMQQASQALVEDFAQAMEDGAMRDIARKFRDKSRMATTQQLVALNKDLAEPVRQACGASDNFTRQSLVSKAFTGLLDANLDCFRVASASVEKTLTSAQQVLNVKPQVYTSPLPRQSEAAMPTPQRNSAPPVVAAQFGVAPSVTSRSTAQSGTTSPTTFDDLLGGMDSSTAPKTYTTSAPAAADLLDFGLGCSTPGEGGGYGNGSLPVRTETSSSPLDFDLSATFGAGPPRANTFAPTPATNNDLSLEGMSWPTKEEEDESCIKARVEAWQDGKNMRTMLVSLHEVAPSGAGWVPVKLGDVGQASDVKAVYRKAVLAVHPDKQQGLGAQTLGHFVFEALREQWNVFRTQERV